MYSVKYICGRVNVGFNQIFGGTPMTVHCILKAFENSEQYRIDPIDRRVFAKLEGDKFRDKFRKLTAGAEIIHVDDTLVLEKMFRAEMNPPQVIGVIARSPVKKYMGWACVYTPDWFYQSKVIRLNYAEEYNNKMDYRDKIKIIRHGVDVKYLHPNFKSVRKYILWAGAKNRPAKNYGLFEDIMSVVKLPEPYEFKVISSYNVNDYWRLLDETALLINTSKYESFCCALFEAKSKGVVTIHKERLHDHFRIGHHHDGSEIQVPYTVEGYAEAIEDILYYPESKEYIKYLGERQREYVLRTATLDYMREDMEEVYGQVII
jgi:hypothetical protein